MKTISVLIDTLVHNGVLRDVDELIEMEDNEADALIDMGAAIEASQDQQEQDKDDQPKKPSRKK
ncbi:MAG: hypothetical protein IPI97_08105 [Nitrosomonas sp.]|jgi:hypothetical protein|nr:hypothetical protein [Nitrosomonas sp.]